MGLHEWSSVSTGGLIVLVMWGHKAWMHDDAKQTNHDQAHNSNR